MIWICRECAKNEKEERGKVSPHQDEQSKSAFPTHSILGGAVGALTGNPVLIAIGAGAGGLIDFKDEIASKFSLSSYCEICGEESKLEGCAICGKEICQSCRFLLADRQEEDGVSYIPRSSEHTSYGPPAAWPDQKGITGEQVEEVIPLSDGDQESDQGDWDFSQEAGGWESEGETTFGHPDGWSPEAGEAGGEVGDGSGEAGEGNGSVGEGSSNSGGD